MPTFTKFENSVVLELINDFLAKDSSSSFGSNIRYRRNTEDLKVVPVSPASILSDTGVTNDDDLIDDELLDEALIRATRDERTVRRNQELELLVKLFKNKQLSTNDIVKNMAKQYGERGGRRGGRKCSVCGRTRG